MDFLVISERVTDEPNELMMIDQIRRYTGAFENARVFLIVGGKVHDNRWRRIGAISRASNAAIGRKGTPEFVAHLIYFVSLVLVGTRLIKKKPNIQYVTNPYGHYTLGAIAVVIAKITRRRAIVRVASSVSEVLTRPGMRYRIAYSMLMRLERFAFDHADAIAKVSLMPLELKYRRKTFDIPYLIEKPYGSVPPKARAAKSILFVGRLEAEKGVTILLEATRILREGQCKTSVTIVGAGSLQDALRHELARKELAGNVMMKGFVTHPNILRMMRGATLLVLPSISEYAPNVVIEAALNGLPVIATYTGGVPYMIKHRRTGILVRPMDPYALANAIKELLLDSRLRRRLASAARKSTARRFSPERAKLAAQEMLNYIFKPELSKARHAFKT